MRQVVFGRNAATFPVTDARIMDHRIESGECVHLFGHAAGLSDTRQIANHDSLGLRYSRQRLFPTLLIPRVQNHAVSLLHQELSDHSTQPIGRTCDEYTCHDRVPFGVAKRCMMDL
jgi:hypothetical protein